MLYERRDAVAVITLSRPEKANAMTQAMTEELHEACRRADADREVRAVVLTGEGRHFSAGSDLSSLELLDAPWDYRNRVDYCDAVLALRTPAVAMINGAAFGGGLEMALSCDIRVASTGARFAAPEVKLGWVGGGGASQLLPRLCGYGNAATMLLTGDPVDAAEAYRIGLVQVLADPDELERTALELATRVAANAPIATQAAKAALRRSLSVGIEAGMDYENELITVCLGTRDRHEGTRAFFEKRPPVFEGR
ncbi:MAG: enoyl-CoA hydratase/isomerase family protein [Actinobacteria bacterium]|nr:enoyl-CoA hydratase/isomerase family protein [Actinomycetota bacterium]